MVAPAEAGHVAAAAVALEAPVESWPRAASDKGHKVQVAKQDDNWSDEYTYDFTDPEEAVPKEIAPRAEQPRKRQDEVLV